MAIKTIWRLHEVMARTGLSRLTIYEKMQLGEFPLAIAVGERSLCWIADEVIEWTNEQTRKRYPKNPE